MVQWLGYLGFHPGGPGSIPGNGTTNLLFSISNLFQTFKTLHSLLSVSSNLNFQLLFLLFPKIIFFQIIKIYPCSPNLFLVHLKTIPKLSQRSKYLKILYFQVKDPKIFNYFLNIQTFIKDNSYLPVSITPSLTSQFIIDCRRS